VPERVVVVDAAGQAVAVAFDPRTNSGHTFAWLDLAIVAAWGVVGALYAMRRFSWTPLATNPAVFMITCSWVPPATPKYT
jgi:CHASE2 domain-containing sensor protein